MKALTQKFIQFGNPFEEKGLRSLILSTHDIMQQKSAEVLKSAKSTEKTQYNGYVEERLEKRTKVITETIKKNQFQVFAKRKKSKQQ